MTRQTLDIYVFNGSPQLRQERDDLIAELTVWAQAKLEAGIRPTALQRALLDVSHMAAGTGDAGKALIAAFKPKGFVPGFATVGEARAAGRKAFAKTNGKGGCEDRDFYVAQNEHGRWHFVEGTRPKPAV